MLGFLKNAFGYVAGASSIIGLAILLFKAEEAVVFVVAFYCVAITSLMVAVYRAVCKSLFSSHKDKFIRVATFCTFKCDDGKNATFGIRRLIQSKVPFLDHIDHKFKWHGSGTPSIFLNGNDVSSSFAPNNRPEDFDSITVDLGKVLCYNESASFNLEFRSQYSDYEPRIRCKVEDPMQVLQFRVLLGLKDGPQKPAKIYKSPINSETGSTPVEIGTVDFDMAHKVYFHVIEKPEIGYFYSIAWEK